MRGNDLTVARFSPEHFDAIELQPAQAYVREHMTRAQLDRLALGGPAYTVLRDGRPVLLGGLVEFNAERGMLWSILSAHAGPVLLRLHRQTLRFLETVDRPEITATCQTGYAAGARWLALLGFEWWQALGPYGPARVPHDLYLRVR